MDKDNFHALPRLFHPQGISTSNWYLDNFRERSGRENYRWLKFFYISGNFSYLPNGACIGWFFKWWCDHDDWLSRLLWRPPEVILASSSDGDACMKLKMKSLYPVGAAWQPHTRVSEIVRRLFVDNCHCRPDHKLVREDFLCEDNRLCDFSDVDSSQL